MHVGTLFAAHCALCCGADVYRPESCHVILHAVTSHNVINLIIININIYNITINTNIINW